MLVLWAPGILEERPLEFTESHSLRARKVKWLCKAIITVSGKAQPIKTHLAQFSIPAPQPETPYIPSTQSKLYTLFSGSILG